MFAIFSDIIFSLLTANLLITKELLLSHKQAKFVEWKHGDINIHFPIIQSEYGGKFIFAIIL